MRGAGGNETSALIALMYVGIVFASLFSTPFRGEAVLIPSVLIPGYLIVASLVLRGLAGRRGNIRGEIA
jgi:hypothetical protein